MPQKTKFILHGGSIKIDNASNREFVKEFAQGLGPDDFVLMVFFAYNKLERSERYEFFKKRYTEYLSKNLKFLEAEEEKFREQVRKSKVIILHGGDTEIIIRNMKQFPWFKEEVKGKTVVGSSAGVYVLSEYCYSNDTDEVYRGLGILLLRTRCHYKGEDDKIKEKFSEYPDSLQYELLALKDCEYKVIYK